MKCKQNSIIQFLWFLLQNDSVGNSPQAVVMFVGVRQKQICLMGKQGIWDCEDYFTVHLLSLSFGAVQGDCHWILWKKKKKAVGIPTDHMNP